MLQIIDFISPKSKTQFCTSIVNTGFAIINNVDFDFSKLTYAYDLWKKFFDSNDKYNYPYYAEKHDGFYPHAHTINGEIKIMGLVESYYYTTESKISGEINNITQELMHQLYFIVKPLMEGLVEYANIIGNIKQLFDLDHCCYRFMHYPPLSSLSQKDILLREFRLEPHKDFSHITLLPKIGPDSGLEIMDDKNQNWQKIGTNIKNSIIVNVGNSLQLLSNGYLKSTLHRVALPPTTEWSVPRLSSAFFV